jgi:hypothetical protein
MVLSQIAYSMYWPIYGSQFFTRLLSIRELVLNRGAITLSEGELLLFPFKTLGFYAFSEIPEHSMVPLFT